MKINSDVNILGSLSDWNLILVFLKENISAIRVNGGLNAYTNIKTIKSIKLFEKAITSNLIKFCNPDIEFLIRNTLESENISHDSRLLLFWNASYNNDLLNYLNTKVYFTSLFSGRVTFQHDEIIACLKELKENEPYLKNWSDSTLKTTASKYLTLLKKFNLMEGTNKKTINATYLSDKMFVLFVYWITSIEEKTNILESEWLKYSFSERETFIERALSKKLSKYFNIQYTGDKLKIETLMPYNRIYEAVK